MNFVAYCKHKLECHIKMLQIYSRAAVKFEGDELQRELTESWSDDVPFRLEMALVVNKVTHAILNPSE
jgi:hypothetical protein